MSRPFSGVNICTEQIEWSDFYLLFISQRAVNRKVDSKKIESQWVVEVRRDKNSKWLIIFYVSTRKGIAFYRLLQFSELERCLSRQIRLRSSIPAGTGMIEDQNNTSKPAINQTIHVRVHTRFRNSNWLTSCAWVFGANIEIRYSLGRNGEAFRKLTADSF